MSFRIATLFITLVSVVSPALGQTAQDIFDKARELDKAYRYDSAMILYEKARTLFPKGSEGEGLACRFIGDIYKYVLYDFDKAETNYERALEIQMALDPTHVKNRMRLHYNLATTNRSQHDYETSITWCLKAIEGALELKDYPYLERSYSILGNIYRDMHQFDSAVVYYGKGVAVNKEINKGKPNETLAGLYSAWGSAGVEQGDFDDASRKLTEAIRIFRQVKVNDRLLYLHTARLLSEVEIKRSNLDLAWSVLHEADQIRSDLKIDRGGPASAMFKTFGDFALAKKDTAAALKFYQDALQATTTESLGDERHPLNPSNINLVDFKNFAYEALLAKASLVKGMEAIVCYDLAEELMIASRGELDTENAKWQYIDANYQLYENIFETLYMSNIHDNSILIGYMENSKSKSLADALHEVELKRALGSNDTLLTQLKDLKQHSLLLQHQINGKNDAAARDQLIENSQKISALEEFINNKYPSYLKTKFQTSSVNIDVLQTRIGLLDAVFVEYFWGDDNIYAFVMSGDSTGFYQIRTSSAVAALISEYTSLFIGRANKYSPEAVDQFSTLSNQLYKFLIGPFSQYLSGRRRLIVVPDGPLMQLPFETLVSKKEGGTYKNLPYLLNTHIVSYVFSASHLLAPRPAVRSNPSLLAFGFTDGANVRSDAGMGEIAGTETELLSLSDKFPRGTYLYGAGVTEKNFKERAADFDLLHLAVHGMGDTDEDYSATLHFRDEDGLEDGRLYWYELYNMNLKASLAVLSSCESGIGKTYRGEGMLSMANAFTFAGCGNIVMGLWKVDDQVSVKLMDTFYSELLNGMAIDEALALAKRTYLASADQVSANPKLWGSLVAYGESPILKADEIPAWWVVVALTALVAAIVFLVAKTKKK